MRPVSSREEYLKLRGDERQVRFVDQIRRPSPCSPCEGEGKKNPDIAKLKSKLIQFNYSCIPEHSTPLPREGEVGRGSGFPLKGCKTPSTTVGMDIDFVRNENEDEAEYLKRMQAVPELVLSKKDELGLLMLERSAS